MTDQQPEVQPRAVLIDDVSYVVDDLPEGIQQAIATYDAWCRDRNDAQSKAAQLVAATQHLAGQISTAVKAHVAAQEEASENQVTAGDDAPDAEVTASLDIPAEDGE